MAASQHISSATRARYLKPPTNDSCQHSQAADLALPRHLVVLMLLPVPLVVTSLPAQRKIRVLTQHAQGESAIDSVCEAGARETCEQSRRNAIAMRCNWPILGRFGADGTSQVDQRHINQHKKYHRPSRCGWPCLHHQRLVRGRHSCCSPSTVGLSCE